jgi:predicted NBD/HSP70 family sugar kinase
MRGNPVRSAVAKAGNASEEGAAGLGLIREQVERFTREGLRARLVRPFDAQQVLAGFRKRDGEMVLDVDIGGDKITAAKFAVRDGALQLAEHVLMQQGDDGRGYLDALRKLAEMASDLGIRVGISIAGPITGTRLDAGPNLACLAQELQASYAGDFARLFRNVSLANDAEAGLLAAALEAARRYPDSRDVIYVINGSGLGGAVLAGNCIYAAEPGHVAVVNELNSLQGFAQAKPCGLGGATHTCMEAVGASKAGVEDIWRKVRGDRLNGRQIAACLTAGDSFAHALYSNSARITAHVVIGMATAFGMLDADGGPVVVGHGGIFQVPSYGEWLSKILNRALGRAPRVLFTKDFSDNTCLEGAAIAALVGGA